MSIKMVVFLILSICFLLPFFVASSFQGHHFLLKYELFFLAKPLPGDPSSLPKHPPSKEFDGKVGDGVFLLPEYALWDYVATKWYRAPKLCGSFYSKVVQILLRLKMDLPKENILWSCLPWEKNISV